MTSHVQELFDIVQPLLSGGWSYTIHGRAEREET